MKYVLNEIKRTLQFRVFFVTIFLTGVVSYIISLYDGSSFVDYYSIMLSNILLLYLIVLCSGITTDDFEYGTYKIVYTGKYSYKQILSLKLLICVIIGMIMSFIVYFIPAIFNLFIEKSIALGSSYKKIPLILISYSAASFSLGAFGIMMGILTKRFSSNFIITLLLFFGVLAQLIDTASIYLTGWFRVVISILPFTIVPKVFTSNSINLYEVAVLVSSGFVFMSASLLNKEIWRK